MRDQACQFLGTLPEEIRRNYQRLVQALSRRFDSESQTELFRVQLRNRVRLPNESIPELSQEIRRLVRHSYPEAPHSLVEMLGKDYFIDAVNDSDMRWRMFQLKVTNLDEATAAAVEIEAYKKAEIQRHGAKRYVRELDIKQNSNSEEATARLQKQIDELTRRLRDFEFNPPRNDIRCYRCQGKGHYAKNCFSNKRQQPENRQRLN
jgi:CRISPR/Cas system-associated exonuclease Cas4 (RecB family)